MRKLETVWIALVIGVLVAAAGPAPADSPELAKRKQEHEAALDAILAQLNLSAEQASKIATIRNSPEEIAKVRAQARVLRRELRAARESKDETQVAAAEAKIGAFRADHPQTIREVLTPEQRPTFDALIKKRVETARADRAQRAAEAQPAD